VERIDEPGEGDERSILLGWLAFHRNRLAVKCNGMSPAQLIERSAPPSTMSLLGLVRHMTEMERVYAAWALGGEARLEFVYGDYTDDGPDWDFDVDATMVTVSFKNWEREQRAADAAIARYATLDAVGAGNRRSVRWNLQKLVGEYSRHNGHADLLRERIDGAIGE